MEPNGARSPLRARTFAPALALGLLLAVALAHGASLRLPFLCDDWFLVDEANLPRTWLQEFGFGWASFEQWIRPVPLVTLRLQALLHGAEPFAFHAFNLLAHAAAAGALAWVVLEWGGSRCAATAAALLFALHPLTVEASAWVAARSDLLCGLFAALALAATLRYVRAGGRAAGAAAIACGVLAALSKESGLALVLLVPLVPRGARATDGASESDAGMRARWLRCVAIAIALGLAYAAARFATFGGLGGYQAAGESQHLVGGFGAAVQRLLSIARALAIPARRESYPAGFGVLRWLPLALVAAGVLSACLRSPRAAARVGLLCLASIAAVCLPLATWWEFEADLRGQRSLYLPIAAACAAAGLALDALAERRAPRSALCVAACVVLSAALGWSTAHAHRQWRAGAALSEHVFERLAQRVAARTDRPAWFTVGQPDALGPAFVWRNGLTQAAWLRLGPDSAVYPLTAEEAVWFDKPREARERFLRVTYTIRPERPMVCLRWDPSARDWREL
ncbi:MAG: hypothetical protein EPO68_02410 [Planctomycetota bacterium]|nr:MAG: hypothetical protein EPO68_02410 [Planctomycetota bacterium]